MNIDCNEANETATMQLLRRAGLPVRERYAQVLELLSAAPDRGFTVVDIYKTMLPVHPDLNLASIYRILRGLSASELVQCQPGQKGYGGGKHSFSLKHSSGVQLHN